MSELVQYQNSGIDVWKDPEKIRKLFAPNLSKDEFDYFFGLSQALGANPFLREIWSVKYGNSPASVFVGRDFYRRKAQEQPSYEGHIVDSVYENDDFVRSFSADGISINLTPAPHNERGKLVGAFCLVYIAGRKPAYNFCLLAEYTTGKSLWATKPDTMIKKVAESQGLRSAYQGIFGGTYDESEQWEQPLSVESVKPKNDPELLEKVKSAAKSAGQNYVKALNRKLREGVTNSELAEILIKCESSILTGAEENLDELPRLNIFEEVQKQTDGYYNHPIHLQNTLKKIFEGDIPTTASDEYLIEMAVAHWKEKSVNEN